jgi:hypothetical protein
VYANRVSLPDWLATLENERDCKECKLEHPGVQEAIQAAAEKNGWRREYVVNDYLGNVMNERKVPWVIAGSGRDVSYFWCPKEAMP